jgi:hypothetical protein
MRKSFGPALAAALVSASLAMPGLAQQNKGVKAAPVPADTVAISPEAYVGRQIMVEGYVDDMYGPRLFEIQKEARKSLSDVGPGRSEGSNHGQDLAVYIPEGVTLPTIEHNKKIRVTGTLQRGLTADVEGKAGHDWDNRPVLVVDTIELR